MSYLIQKGWYFFYVRFEFFIAKYTVFRWKSPNIGSFILKLRSSDGEFSTFSFRLLTRMKAIFFLELLMI